MTNLVFRNNKLTAVSAAGSVPHVAVRFNPWVPAGVGGMPAINANIYNNTFDGWLTAGVGVYTNLTPVLVADFVTGSAVSVNSNNFLNIGASGTDIVHGTVGPNINAVSNYYSDGAANTMGNVSVSGSAATPHSVAGRNPNYVTFRGDFDLDNAVSDADRLVWSNNFGLVGPGATYFKGDATLDQIVSAADLLVWKRHNGLDINATAAAPAPSVTPGAPIIRYSVYTGKLTIKGAASTAWAFEFPSGATELSVSSHTEGNLGASWLYTAITNWPATNRFEFIDASAGAAPAPAAETEVATLQPNLTDSAFGPVTYYVGSNTFQTTVTVLGKGTLISIR